MYKQSTPTFPSAIHRHILRHMILLTKLRYWIPWAWKDHVIPAKSKYADRKSSAYLRGTWLKTKKYQTVILAYLRYVSTRFIAPWILYILNQFRFIFSSIFILAPGQSLIHTICPKYLLEPRISRVSSTCHTLRCSKQALLWQYLARSLSTLEENGRESC